MLNSYIRLPRQSILKREELSILEDFLFEHKACSTLGFEDRLKVEFRFKEADALTCYSERSLTR